MAVRLLKMRRKMFLGGSTISKKPTSSRIHMYIDDDNQNKIMMTRMTRMTRIVTAIVHKIILLMFQHPKTLDPK